MRRKYTGFVKTLAISFLIFFIFFSFFMVQAGAVAAAEAADTAEVAEAPYVRVVINGIPGNYTDTALEINDRVLLPFRELLTKLGVTNDDEHIIWNDDEESVTVIDKSNIIRLQIGNPVMVVNGVEKTFDVAPYFYHKNDRTYIPVRAVSELLDKKILWEEDTTTVYIRDNENYAATLELLENIQNKEEATKIHATTDSLVNFRVTTNGDPLPDADADGVLRSSMKIEQDIYADLDNHITHMSQKSEIEGSKIGFDFFIIEDRSFIKIDGVGFDWYDASDQGIDFDYTLEQITPLAEQMDARALSDVAMGLAATKGSDGTYTIVGEPLAGADINVVLDAVTGLVQQDAITISEIKFNKFQIGTTIDENYYPIKAVVSVVMDFSLTEKTAGNNEVVVYFSADMYMTVYYDILGPDYAIATPEGVKALL